MKLLLTCLAFCICVGLHGVHSAAAPAPGKLVYPWTEWLKLRATTTPAPVPVDNGMDEVTQEEFLSFLGRAILPKTSKKETFSAFGATTTKKPSIIDVGDFWAPPTVGPNMTSPEVIDPAFWAAKKTMFISKLFAALAKQVLNATGDVTTTTASPQESLMKEIDTVLLSDVARAIAEDDDAPTAPSKALMAKIKAEMKKEEKKAAKNKPTPKPLPWAKFIPTTVAPIEVQDVETTTSHPTLDYAKLAQALIS